VARPKGRRRIRKLRLFALLALLAVLGLASFSVGLVTAIAGEIPSLDPSRIHNQTDGFIYASNGRVLSVLRGSQSRILLRSDQISPLMKQAIVAIEDKRFYEHRGVDVRGIMRALWADVRGGGVVQGGSTITQQFVKNTYTKNQRSIARLMLVDRLRQSEVAERVGVSRATISVMAERARIRRIEGLLAVLRRIVADGIAAREAP